MADQKIHGQYILTEILLPDLAVVEKFAARFAPLLEIGDVVALDGALGAGKTTLCRAIIHGLGYGGDVPSPTFNLVQIYEPPTADHIRPTIWHMDLYRLEKPEEAFEIGLEEAFDTAASLIEWPSKLGPYLPPGALILRLETCSNRDPDNEARKLTILGDMVWQGRLTEGLVL